VEVPTLVGPPRLRFHPERKAARSYDFRGKGRAFVAQRARGDQFVEVQVVVPRVADERTKEILREFARLNPEDPRQELKKYS